MEYLKISNEGLLDIRLVSLMGGTTKREDEFKIGQFGTGLKYALAYLLRNNIHFEIWIGGKLVEVSTKNEEIRNEVFQVVYIDGEKTSLTTTMGMDWEAWMIVRELWCNALDEEEGAKEIVSGPPWKGEDWETCFYIQNVGGILEVTQNWNQYFMHEVEPLQDNHSFAVYPKTGKGMRVFKNGVLIYKNEEFKKEPMFWYDYKSATINEMRQYYFQKSDIANIVMGFNQRCAEYYLENVIGSWEEDLDYSWSWRKPSDDWEVAIGESKIIADKTFERMKEQGHIGKEDELVMTKVPRKMFEKLTQQFKTGISALKMSKQLNSYVELKDSDKHWQKLNEGLAVLDTCGYEIPTDLEWKIVVFGNANLIAQINKESGEVFVSERIKEMAIIEVCRMIVEEVEHYRTDFSDATRDFQNHFISLYVNSLLEKEGVRL